MNKSKMIIFYSAIAAERFGTFRYLRADGTEVEGTSAYSTEEEGNKNYKWPDKECRGEVVEAIGPGRSPTKENEYKYNFRPTVNHINSFKDIKIL